MFRRYTGRIPEQSMDPGKITLKVSPRDPSTMLAMTEATFA